MRKLTALLLSLALVLSLICVAGAENTEDLTVYLRRIVNPEDNAAYTLGNLEYGQLEPGDVNPEDYIKLLEGLTLEEVDESEAPEGIYTVLTFPEDKVRFDFYESDNNVCFIREVKNDEESTLFRAVMPEDRASAGNIVSAWLYSIADAQGLAEEIEAEMPGEGWVKDTLEKYNWVSDRALLELFLEDTNNYKVLITWASSAWECEEWTYACDYAPDLGALFAGHVIRETVTYDDNGAETGRKTAYEKDSDAVFIVNDRDELVILNAGDESLDMKVFEKVASGDGEETAEEPAAWDVPDSMEVTEELRAKFDQALEGLVGVGYEPAAFLAEKDGALCFLAKATVVYPGAKPYFALVYVDANGSLMNIWELWIDAHANP